MNKCIIPLLVVFCRAGSAFAADSTQYLALQIFTGALDSNDMRKAFPPPPGNLRQAVIDLRDRIGVGPAAGRRLGFVVGPISFDNTDEQVRGSSPTVLKSHWRRALPSAFILTIRCSGVGSRN